MKIFFIVAVSAALATIATTCTQTQPATTSPPPTTNCPTTPACSAWGDIVPSLGDGDITNGNYYTVIPAQPIMNSLTVGKTLIYDDGTLSGEPEDSATLSGDSQTIYVEFGEVKWVQSLTLAYRQAVSGGAYTINDVTITLLSGDGSTIHSNTDPGGPTLGGEKRYNIPGEEGKGATSMSIHINIELPSAIPGANLPIIGNAAISQDLIPMDPQPQGVAAGNTQENAFTYGIQMQIIACTAGFP
ncbi:uncharacterized protein LOC141907441 isoform X1 [Tubulanus polymorphus]|uniref:uncharacterized protein LOC141907441 isoform X1 n=1 Tax=Tubulanus polymorphus TaxID=672921 RepID=UPI003DA450E8